MSRIFISYKRVDKDKVFKIKGQIESALGEKCWIDLDGIESDAQFKNVIIKAINDCEIVLFMYSNAHTKIVDFENDWTVRELNFAKYKGKRIIFVNIDRSPLTDEFKFDYGTKQQVDATSGEAMKRLIKDLANWLVVNVNDIKRISPVKKISEEIHPIIKGCVYLQIVLYTIFTLTSLWLFLYKPIPYTQSGRTINVFVILSFALSLYVTIYILKLKRWAFWSILALDLVSMVLISMISTRMTGKVQNFELLRQLHGYGHALNFGRGGFLMCLEFLFGVAAHSIVTYFVLQIKYKGKKAWELMI